MLPAIAQSIYYYGIVFRPRIDIYPISYRKGQEVRGMLIDRLELIPVVAKELKYQLSLKNNTFEGSVSTNFKMSTL